VLEFVRRGEQPQQSYVEKCADEVKVHRDSAALCNQGPQNEQGDDGHDRNND
jgi:hypothetical protein